MPELSIRKENNQSARYNEIIQSYLSKDEVDELMQKSDWKGAWEVFKVWFWIACSFFLVAVWPNFFTVVVALVLIGSKQLGCAIIMHDASHYALFSSKKWNNWVGNWFGAYPIIHNVEQYRPYHLQHHLATGTVDDPDINLTKGYPTTKISLLRKFARDLTGVSGFKAYYGLFAMHLGILKYNLGNYIEKITVQDRGYLLQNGFHNLKGPLAANVLLFFILFLAGHPELYFLWIGSLLTTYLFFLRIRSMAEHSMVSDPSNPLINSRTVEVNPLERLLFAALTVNYHLEHHLKFTIPSYRFKKMHRMLKERGLFKKANLEVGYWKIIKLAVMPSKT
jgi:fatty acid desaturase